MTAAEKVINHGYSAYTDGCRCETCRSAKAERERERRARLKATGRAALKRITPPVATAGFIAPRADELTWGDRAACLAVDAEVFFQDGDQGEAKAVCAICPVMPECRSLALRVRPTDGVWAGMTAEELATERTEVAA